MESDTSVSGYDTVTGNWIRANKNKKKPKRKAGKKADKKSYKVDEVKEKGSHETSKCTKKEAASQQQEGPPRAVKKVCGSSACGRPVLDDDDIVMCTKCNVWFHIACQDLPEAALEALGRFDKLCWLCSTCKEHMTEAQTIRDELAFLKQALSEQSLLMKKFCGDQKTVAEMLNKEQKRLEQTIVDHQKMIKETVSSQTEKQTSYVDIVKNSCAEVVQSVPKLTLEIQKSAMEIKKQSEKKHDQEARETNILLHNIPESTSQDVEGRKKYDADSFDNIEYT